MLEHFTMTLTNNLINNLNMDTVCIDGVCYYTTCQEGSKCNMKYCKYNLFTGVQECNEDKPLSILKVIPHRSEILVQSIVDDTTKLSNNNKDNEIKIINKILNKR